MAEQAPEQPDVGQPQFAHHAVVEPFVRLVGSPLTSRLNCYANRARVLALASR